MDFALTDDQHSLKDLAAQILSENSTDESLRQFARGDAPFDTALWSLLAEAGLLGLGIAEEYGGSGFGMAEIGLLLEEQGRTLAPVPLYATLALGARPLSIAGTPEQRSRWLPGIASGSIIATAALEEPGNADPMRPMLRATRDGSAWSLSGVKTAVPYGAEAGLLIVTASLADSTPIAFLVDPAASDLSIASQITTGGEPHAHIRFDGVRLHAEDVLGNADQGEDSVRTIIRHARLGLTAMQLGVAQSALRRTAEYTSERIQFGRPIGSMQAVQQRAADAFIDLEAMRSSYLRAVWALDKGCVNDAEIATAKYWAAMGGHRITHSAQHLHGGMGADIDYPIHRYFLRARQIESALGGASLMVATIGQAIAAGHANPLTEV